MLDGRIEIDGRELPAEAVGTNHSLNFGRFDGDGIVVHRYRLWLSRETAQRHLEAPYARLVQELRADDRFEPSRLSKIGYPPFAEVLRSHPAQLAEIIDHLGRDLLSAVFPYGGQSRYVINSLDGHELDADGLRIWGRCFEYASPRRGEFLAIQTPRRPPK